MKKLLVMAAAALAAASSAQVRFNEFMVNPPGSDNGFEFFELKGNPNTALTGLTLLVIEGDVGTSNVEGTIDQAIPLGLLSTGSNGLLLLRDGTVVLQPAPAIGTTVHVQDFAPDVENGGNTFMIVSGFTGSVGDDLDTDDDGNLDSTPWTSVVDAISYSEDSPNAVSLSYAGAFGGPEFPQQEFTADVYSIFGTNKLILDVLGANPGPFTFDPVEVVDVNGNPFTLPDTWLLTPGSENPSPVGFILPDSFNITQGLPFGGTLTSLHNSDDDKLFILSDENEPNAAIEIVGINAPANPSSLKLILESSATRDDLSEFIDAFNYFTNAFQGVGSRTTSLGDSMTEINLSTPGNFVAGTGEVKMRLRYIPQQDLEAADGWSETIDRVNWEAL